MGILPEERKTSNWSTQISLSSSTGLSFFTNATTYLARAAGSASQLKKFQKKSSFQLITENCKFGFSYIIPPLPLC